MLKCLIVAGLLPFLFTICGPREDPNFSRDKRGLAVKLVQDSPGRDKTHKTVDFATQEVMLLRASGVQVAEYGWSADMDSASKDIYSVRFAYKGREGVKEALWSVNVVTREVKARNPQAHKYSW